ncbi:putative ADAM metalloprotease [Danaus plexippus plexippus]|uniref:ADAM metalloprotease n=1 Tax=Danaus plexippus plexippus TaxID=278856 RepID=A0A212FIE4_DANPL|nr:putative ADAM metalloprotease [Danaus plexippus plexippus]
MAIGDIAYPREGIHHPELVMKMNFDGREHVLDLRLNEDLITKDHVIAYQKDGETVIHRPTLKELDICQYSGKVRDKKESWVAVSTCDGVRGIIHDGQTMRYIEPADRNEIDSQHYLYEHSDLNTDFHCGYSGGITTNDTYDPELMKRHMHSRNVEKSRISRYKRDAYEDTEVRGPFKVNKLSRFVELVLVADNREFRANGESKETVHRQLKDVANIINSVYTPLNIFIALVGVVVWNERDEIRLEEDGDKTLTEFLHYRKRLLPVMPNDNAHLLTRQKFKDGVVGKALKGPICTYNFSGGVATNHSEVIGLVATTIAHEMGHNFGMEHDTEADCECPDEKCIMSPSSTSVTPTKWSSCSLRSLALAFERGMDYCLRNKPKRLFEPSTCGNGFIEPGEQCDCGLAGDPACTACCDPRACVLRSNATCAAGECCDTTTCRPKPAGTVCRAADKECDLAEYCSGHSEYCPRDVYKMDATPCGGGKAYCAGGSCRTHTDQCRLLWGFSGENSDVQCYTNSNTKGDRKGNCGYHREDPPVYYKCSKEDSLCGLLQCRHLNERLEFGMESVSTLSAVFINNNGTIIPCRTAMVDMGTSDPDPGFVPDGAKCGDDKMCMKHRCVSIAEVTSEIARKETSVCPSNCSGHGVCNSEGHCHCDSGFAPPLCELPGPGGSVDSGPATDASIQRNFMVAMYIIFLGILPSVLLVMLLMYYSRHNVLLCWKKPKKSYVNNIFNGDRFKRFKTSTDSFVRLISFRRTQKKNMCRKCQDDIYSNICEHKENIDSTWSFNISSKIINMLNSNKHDESKKFQRKINKDDIKVADDLDLANVRVKVEPKINKSNIVIVKTGLASTTNEHVKAEINTTKQEVSLDRNKTKKNIVVTNKINTDVIYENCIPNKTPFSYFSVQSPKKNSLQRRLSRSATKFAANFQNNSQNNAQPVNVHTLSNSDDMSSSLLRSDSDRSPSGNINPSVNFFGNFKGFSLTPMDKNSQNETDVKDKKDNVQKSAKITPVHRSGSNSQNIAQGSKPILRSAPPLPVVPNTAKLSPKTSPSIKRTNSSVQNRIKAFMGTEKAEEIPVNTAPRPTISSPILEASTCTAKELISPLQGSKTLGPVRAAPTVPNFSPDLPKRPLSMHSAGNVPQKPLPEEPKKVKEGISLNRIASFLKQDKPKEKDRNPVERSHSLPKNGNNQLKVKTGDKVALRNLQISGPILQKEIDLPVTTVPVVSDSEEADDSKAFVNRAQSMRAPASQKPVLQSFASMRQAPGVPRPLSCVGRPTAPPPPLPSQPKNEEQSIYQNPKVQNDIKSTDYVDCIEEKQVPLAHIDEESGDNIYAIIEESPEKHFKPMPGRPPKSTQAPFEEYNVPKPITSNSGSSESLGLLGEIVNEIQNRNFDSIYCTNSLARMKDKNKNTDSNRDSTYMNTDYKSPESVYSNSETKSSAASTTSSGYLHPSAVNVPTYMQKDSDELEIEKPPSPTLKTNSKIPTFTRQVTPPGLRTFKNIPQSPKTTTRSNLKTIPNSPDLVSSCAVPETQNAKAPDVINNNKTEPPKLATKPNTTKTTDNRPPLKPVPSEKKPNVKPTPVPKTNSALSMNKTDKNPPLNRTTSKTDSNVKAIADSLNKNRPKIVPKPNNIQKTEAVKTNATKLSAKPSNVASLQQKFENRKSLGKEISVKK